MAKLLSIVARPDAPIACDMTTATDTLAERLAEYRRLFEHALTSRESTATATTFRFAARPGVREWVCDLAKREAACCPFLSYEIDEQGEEIVWTTAGGLGASEMAILDELLDGPEGSGQSACEERPGAVQLALPIRPVVVAGTVEVEGGGGA
jgi:hypothetical protein